jgi:hypothetical protein
MLRLFMGQVRPDGQERTDELYIDDALTFSSVTFDLMQSFLDEGVRIGTVPYGDYRHQIQKFFLALLGSVHRFRYDPDLWMQFTHYGLLDERNVQVASVLAKRIPLDSRSAPADLRLMLMIMAMNSGDDGTAQKLHNADHDPREGDDLKWLYATYLAMRGREGEASKLIARLRPVTPSYRPRMEALRTYLLAKSGKTTQARKRLIMTSTDIVERGLHGLAWAALGDWKRAEPILAEQMKSQDWAFRFVGERAMSVLYEQYRKTNQLGKARSIALVAAASQPGNRLYDKYSFAAKPGIAQFAGTVQASAAALDDRTDIVNLGASERTYILGKLTFTITGGELTGTFLEDSGRSHTFHGKVDSLGNLSGRTQWNGIQCDVSAKLAPPSIYKTFPGLRQFGPHFQFIDDAGCRVALYGRILAGF